MSKDTNGPSPSTIKAVAKQIIRDSTGGARWAAIWRGAAKECPNVSKSKIQGAVKSMLNSDLEIEKVGRGLYTMRGQSDETVTPFVENVSVNIVTPQGGTRTVTEATFYEPFAEWLLDQEEVNAVRPLGGNMLKSKWGTPDVIGVLKPQAADPIKFEFQIVSAEIKIEPTQTIVAFGQAVAYRLFSHKSFIVLPRATTKVDIDRLEALAILQGIGLVTFDHQSPDSPGFELRVPARLASPDMYYVNEMAKRIREHAEDAFNELF